MTKWCPVCGQGWPDARAVCVDCLAGLVDHLDTTLRCRHCGRSWPGRMQSCPDCLAELVPDPARAADLLTEALARGLRLPRPAHVRPFARGVDCTLLRIAPRSSLLYVGLDELVEAYVDGRDHRAAPPLTCHDPDGSLLFRLDGYPVADAAVTATGRDGAPLATFLRLPGIGQGLDVRDETSAPAARLRRSPGSDRRYDLVETGGTVLGACLRTDVDVGACIDDQWSLTVEGPLPLEPLAAVAIVLAAKVLLGRPGPVQRRFAPEDSDDDAAG